MRTKETLFRVLVLGGLALVAEEACGGATTTDVGKPNGDAGTDANGFPSELPVYVDSGGGSSSGSSGSSSGFPSELPVYVEAGAPKDAGEDAGKGFPSELPIFVDSGK